MERTKVLAAVQNRKNGTNISISWETPMTVASAYRKQGYAVVKCTSAVSRIGCHYTHLAAYKAKDHSNDVEETKQRYEWIPGFERVAKKHIEKGTEYLVLEPQPGNRNVKTTYRVVTPNGDMVVYQTKEQVQALDLVIASEWNKVNDSGIMTLKFENIVEIKPKKGERR